MALRLNLNRNQNMCPCNGGSPKEQALYESVLSLLEEGHSINDLKVSDIAKKAGIGKGTTYEYFKSKEELIGKALFYDIHTKFTDLLMRISEPEGFRNIYMAALAWLEENLNAKQLLYQLISMNGSGWQMPKEVQQFFRERAGHEDIDRLNEIISQISTIAKAEGLIPQDVPLSMVNITVVNGVLSYMIFLRFEKKVTDVDREQMREFCYNSVLKAFRA